MNSDGSYTYTPNPGFTGTDQFTYEICDDGIPSLCVEGTVIITVLPDNDAPVAVNDINNTYVDLPVNGTVATNDDDANDDELKFLLLSQPDSGTVVLNVDGSYEFTPNPGFVGTTQFTYVVCDDGIPGPLCDTATVTIEVFENSGNQNDPPVANNDVFSVLAGNPINGNIISNDVDPNGDNLTINTTPATFPTHGTVTILPNGTFTYTNTSGSDFSGVDSFQYVICDDGMPSICDSAWVYIDVIPDDGGLTNNPPLANTDAAIIYVNDTATGNLVINDSDPDGNNITINTTPVDNPQFGTVTINADGSYTYVPNVGFEGNDQFVYEICDDGNPVLCTQGTAIITVIPDNTPPVANNDIANMLSDSSFTGNVLTNDYDLDGDNLTVNTTPVTNPSNGNVTLDGNGTYTYTPNPGFVGNDQFTYVICDDGIPGPLCDTAIVSIQVFSDSTNNDAPVANDDQFTLLEGTVVTGNVMSNDYDPDLDGLTFTVLTTTPNGTLLPNADGTFNYLPNNGFVGTDSFTYVICDDGIPSLCDTAVAYFEVLPTTDINLPPYAGNDATVTLINTDVSGDLVANDGDPNGNQITINQTPVSNPTNGTVTINSDGTYTYSPDVGFTGTDQFIYEICDDGNPILCTQGTAIVTVLPLSNTAPVAINDVLNVLPGSTENGNVLTNDYDPNGNNLTVNTTPITPPSQGNVTISPNGEYTYIAPANYTGTDSFQYVICDDGAPVLCDTAWVVIEIIPVPTDPTTNQAPIANDDALTVAVNGTVTGINVITTNDFDIDGNIVSAQPISTPGNGTLNFLPNGEVTYTPDAGFVGTDSFYYVICDDGIPTLCDTAKVTIVVLPIADNNPPFAGTDAAVTNENTTVVGDLLGNDGDPDGDNIILNTTVTSNPLNGTVLINSNGTYEYIPVAGFSGTDIFTYEICDDGTPVLCTEGTVVITVLPTNQAPIAIDDNVTTPLGTPLSGDVIVANPNMPDSDPDGDNLTVTLLDSTDTGVLILASDGTFNYTPNGGFIGVDSFTYILCDDGIPGPLCDTATVFISIGAPPCNLLDDTLTIANSDCQSELEVCLPIALSDIGNFILQLDGVNYSGMKFGCDYDTAFVFYVGAVFASGNGPYNITWNVNGQSFAATVQDFTETVSQMNTWDPTGNWTLAGLEIKGGNFDNTYGDIQFVHVQTSSSSLVGFNNVLTARGTQIMVDPSYGQLVAIDTVNNCSDTMTLEIYCLPTDTINVQISDNDTAVICIDVAQLPGNIVSVTNICPSSSGTQAIVNVTNGDNCIEIIGIGVGMDTACIVICDDLGLCDTTIVIINVSVDTLPNCGILNDTLIASTSDCNGTVDVCLPIDISTINNYQINVDGVTYGGLITGCSTNSITGSGLTISASANRIIVIDIVNNCADTTILNVICTPIDTVGVTVTTASDTTICLDTMFFPGNIVSVTNICPAVDTNAIITVDSLGCVTITGSILGQDTACIVICDDLGICDTTIIIIDVEIDGSNLPPVAIDDTFFTDIQTEVIGNVTSNDFDPDSNDVNVTLLTDVDNGVLVLDGDGTFTYTPNTGFVGTDTFTYVLCDDGQPPLCDSAMVFINVVAPNCGNLGDTLVVATTDCDAPLEICLPIELTEIGNYIIYIDGQEYSGFTFGCDYDTAMVYFAGGVNGIGSGPYDISWTIDGALQNSSVPNLQGAVDQMNIWDATGDWSLDGIVIVGGDFTKTYSDIVFTSTVSGQTATVGFNNQLIAHGSVIVAPNTASQIVTVDTVNLCADTSTILVLCTTNDTIDVVVYVNDTDSSCLDISELFGNVTSISNDCPVDNVTLSYDMTTNCVDITGVIPGTDQACIVLCDDYGACDTTFINILVLPDNGDTVYIDIPVNMDTSICMNPLWLPGNVTGVVDLGCSTPTLGAVQTPTDSCVIYSAGSTPGAADTICLVITDDQGNTDTTVYVITVIQTNIPPVAVIDMNTTMPGIPVIGNVLTNDFDLDNNDLVVNTTPVFDPTCGTVILNADGSYQYTPTTGITTCQDSFAYIICDNGMPVLCDTAVVYIEIMDIVIGVNHPPVANNDANVTLEGVPVFGTAFNNDYDIDGNNIIYSTTPLSGPMNGTIVLGSNGSYIYTPDPGFTGEEIVCYVICDDGIPSMCDTACIFITVLPSNDSINYPPFAGDDGYFTDMNTPVSGNVLINDHDPDSNNIVITPTLVVDPVNGTVVLAPNGNFSYLPDSGFCGTDQFVYEICDDGIPSECAMATVYITVSCISSDLTTDTVYVNIPVSTSDLLCVNLNELPGTPIALTDLGCSNLTLGSLSPNTIADTCFTYNASTIPGASDTICAIVVDQFGNVDTTIFIVTVTLDVPTTIDTVYETVWVNTTNTLCVDLSELVDSTSTGMINLGCATTTLGNATMLNDSCYTYTAGSTVGGFDTVCVVVEDASGNLDTTVFIIAVVDISTDTLIHTINTDSSITLCADGSDLIGSILILSDGQCNPLDDGSCFCNNTGNCITYTADTVAGADTLCLITCDEFGICDTTTHIINIVPAIDTISSRH